MIGKSCLNLVGSTVLSEIVLSSPENYLYSCWWRQLGILPRFYTSVTEWLNEHFSGCWIGYRGSFERPSGLPDVSVMSFSYMGICKRICTHVKAKTCWRTEVSHNWRISGYKICLKFKMCKKLCKSVREYELCVHYRCC
jgi:hypothetical protein